MSIPEKQLKRLAEMQKAMDGGAVQPDEFAQVIKVIVDVIKDLQTQLKNEMTGGDMELVKVCKKMMSDMAVMEKKMLKMMGDSSSMSSDKMDKMMRQIMSDMKKMGDTIPNMPDLSIYEKKLKDIENKIPVIKETILDNPRQIRDKLETLKEDERLDASAIKGLTKRENKLSDSIINRAIGILDSRTSFGIQKAEQMRKDIDVRVIGIGTQRLTVSAVAPTNPTINDLWYDIS